MVAWGALGAGAAGYDPTRDAISRLAARGAPTRPAMTAALLALGAGMVVYGLALRPSRAWVLPVVNGMATLAVAALPLDGADDTAHGVVAGLGYVTLAAIPVAVGRRSRLSMVTSVVSGLCLLASVVVATDGLYQRTGLTVAHLWVVVSALGSLRGVEGRGRGPTSPSTTRRARAPAGRHR